MIRTKWWHVRSEGQLTLRQHVFPMTAYSAFTLATSEPCQTGLVPFLKADISRLTGTSCSTDISAFENGTKPVWHGSEVASVNAL